MRAVFSVPPGAIGSRQNRGTRTLLFKPICFEFLSNKTLFERFIKNKTR